MQFCRLANPFRSYFIISASYNLGWQHKYTIMLLYIINGSSPQYRMIPIQTIFEKKREVKNVDESNKSFYVLNLDQHVQQFYRNLNNTLILR